MRFLVQRLIFYAIAFWVALTFNFVLPRAMPGSPADAILQQLGPEIQNTPGLYKEIVAQYGGKHEGLAAIARRK